MTQIHRIDHATLVHHVQSALEGVGVPASIAALEAQIMVEADLHETPSHGVRMLPPLLNALKLGKACANPHIQTLKKFGAMTLLDGQNGPGRYTAMSAMQAAMDSAKTLGIGVCAIKNTTHWGRAHAYACRAAQSGLIGLCITNAMHTMAAWGATRAVIGNNPLAIGIPGENPAEPVVLDIAMSQAAVGKVGTFLREGRQMPQGWGLDAQGNPSTDGNAILKGGAVLPMGGHKGAGLSLMFELMTAVLAGGVFSSRTDVSTGLETDTSKLFIAIDVAAFGEMDTFRSRVAELLGELDETASVRAPFLSPGQRGWAASRENMKLGVPVHEDIVAQLENAGVRLR